MVESGKAKATQMIDRFTLLCYSLLMNLLIPFVKIRLIKKGQHEAGYLFRPQERFGIYEGMPTKDLIWIHAVSLGESRAAAVLLTRIRKSHPSLRFLLTHGTATGREEGMRMLQTGDLQVWQPWDTPQAVNRFLAHFKPKIGLLIETEIWPNLLACAKKQNIPVALINARMSLKSFEKALSLSFLSKPAFRSLCFALAQNEQDAKYLNDLDCVVKQVVGNIKFDAQLNPLQIENGKAWRQKRQRPMVFFASSREGEEKIFLDSIQELSPTARCQVLWCIVPRHPQRFSEVEELIESMGFLCIKRTSCDQLSEVLNLDVSLTQTTVFLGDSMREMNFYYSSAEVALLGGSFMAFGGQNLIESIASECPIIVGPYTYNFGEVASQACAMGAAKEVGDMKSAVSQALHLIEKKTELQEMHASGIRFIRVHQGATERTFQAIDKLLVD